MDSPLLKYHTILIFFWFFQLVSMHVIPYEENDKVATYEANQDAIVKFGDKITLECKFSKTVACGWKRRGLLVKHIQRYRYENGNGNETEDCSLRINNVQEIDIGEWICESLGTSGSLSEIGSVVTVSRQRVYDPAIKKRTVLSATTTNLPLDYYTAEDTGIAITATHPDNSIISVEIMVIIVGLVIIITILGAALFYLILRINRLTRHQACNSEKPQEIVSWALETQLLNTNAEVNDAMP